MAALGLPQGPGLAGWRNPEGRTLAAWKTQEGSRKFAVGRLQDGHLVSQVCNPTGLPTDIAIYEVLPQACRLMRISTDRLVAVVVAGVGCFG